MKLHRLLFFRIEISCYFLQNILEICISPRLEITGETPEQKIAPPPLIIEKDARGSPLLLPNHRTKHIFFVRGHKALLTLGVWYFSFS